MCTRAFALSFLVILVGVLIILRLITIPEKVREKGLTFPRIYRFFKGLFKWFYLPLVYLSLYILIAAQAGAQIISAIVVLAVLLVFPIVQLILYRFFDAETEDPFIKWLEFANYAKAAIFSLLVVLAQTYGSSAYYYYLALVLVAYAGFYLLKFNFREGWLSKIIYVSGEVIFYFLFSLYVSQSSWLNNYYIDLFGLGIILLIDIIDLIIQTVHVCK